MKRNARAGVLGALALALALTPVLAFVGARHFRFIDDFKYALMCTGPFGLYFAWALWRSQSWKWQTIDQRVVFVPEGRTVEEFRGCRELLANYPSAI